MALTAGARTTSAAIADDSVTTAKVQNDAITYAKIQNVSATDKLLGRSTSGAGDVEEITCTSAGRALIDDADASAQRTTLGLAIGTNVQAYNANLAAVSGLATAADKMSYWTGSGTASLADLTSFIRTLLDDASAATARATLGVDTLFISGMIETAANKTYVLDQKAAFNYTINTLDIASSAGTVTAKVQIAGVDVTGISAVSVSSTPATGTATAANSVTAGNKVTMVFSSNSSAVNVGFTLKITRA